MSLNLDSANGGTFALSKAGLAIGSTATQLSITTAVVNVIEGVFQTNVAASASFALVVPALTRIDPITQAVINIFAYQTIGLGQKSAFAVWADAAQVVTVTQGPLVGVNSAADKVMVYANPGNRVLIGVFTVYNASLAANGGFRPQTDALNTAGLTTTYFDTFSFIGKLGF